MRKVFAIFLISGFLWATPLSGVMLYAAEPRAIVFVVSDVGASPRSQKRRRPRWHYRNHYRNVSFRVSPFKTPMAENSSGQ